MWGVNLSKGPIQTLISEAGVHGVVMVSGLIVIVNETSDSAGEILIKIVATVVVLWAAHIYAGTVAKMATLAEGDASAHENLPRAISYAIDHSWGVLLAALIPAMVLLLGVIGLLTHHNAIWGALWADVALLGVIGFLGVSRWTDRLEMRALAGVGTALLGIVLIALKALVH